MNHRSNNHIEINIPMSHTDESAITCMTTSGSGARELLFPLKAQIPLSKQIFLNQHSPIAQLFRMHHQ